MSDLIFCDARGRNSRAFVHAKQAVQHREISATFVFCGQSHYATQTNLELGILIFQPPEGWHYESMPSSFAQNNFLRLFETLNFGIF